MTYKHKLSINNLSKHKLTQLNTKLTQIPYIKHNKIQPNQIPPYLSICLSSSKITQHLITNINKTQKPLSLAHLTHSPFNINLITQKPKR